MSTAHIFYIPILLFTGLLAGFFIGRAHAEKELQQARIRKQRQEALRHLKEKKEKEREEGGGEEVVGG